MQYTTTLNGECTDDFTGTSASAPLVSGVITLALQAKCVYSFAFFPPIFFNNNTHTQYSSMYSVIIMLVSSMFKDQWSVISDSLITKSIGREVAFEVLPAVERAPLMAWIEDIRSENERRHLSQFIVEV